MIKYQRLKSLDGSDSVTRYFPLKEGEDAYVNCFYEVVNNAATKIKGAASGDGIIGFSFGGNKLNVGEIFLDPDEDALYMGYLEDGDTKPDIGDLINGYQRVIDVHDDGDMDEPYYVFKIEQPAASSTGSITDDDAGTLVPYQKKTEE